MLVFAEYLSSQGDTVQKTWRSNCGVKHETNRDKGRESGNDAVKPMQNRPAYEQDMNCMKGNEENLLRRLRRDERGREKKNDEKVGWYRRDHTQDKTITSHLRADAVQPVLVGFLSNRLNYLKPNTHTTK